MAGVVDTTYTFTATDTITSTKMNNIIDQTVFTSDAITGSTLAVDTGKLKVNTITASEIASNAVTTAKISDGSVTTAKLSSGKPVWTNWTTASPYISTLTLASERTSANEGDTSILFRSGDPTTNASFDASIKRESGADGKLIIENAVDDTSTVTNGSIELKIDGTKHVAIENDGKIVHGTAPIPVPSGTAPVYGARAWVNFNAQTNDDLGGAYTRTSPSVDVTVNATAHGLIAGNLIFLDFTVGTGTAPFDGVYEVKEPITNDSFTVASSVGTSSTGTVSLKRKTIRAGGNVSCVSSGRENPVIPPTASVAPSVGYHVLNFSTEMSDSNFAISGVVNQTGGLTAAAANDLLSGIAYNSKCANIITISVGSTETDCLHTNVTIIR
jgi:hypothetical protein